jgi:hypothetical protein
MVKHKLTMQTCHAYESQNNGLRSNHGGAGIIVNIY